VSRDSDRTALPGRAMTLRIIALSTRIRDASASGAAATSLSKVASFQTIWPARA
jgi:hypothetical protein